MKSARCTGLIPRCLGTLFLVFLREVDVVINNLFLHARAGIEFAFLHPSKHILKSHALPVSHG